MVRHYNIRSNGRDYVRHAIECDWCGVVTRRDELTKLVNTRGVQTVACDTCTSRLRDMGGMGAGSQQVVCGECSTGVL